MAQSEPQYSIDIVAAMAERTIKRLWIVIIILIALLAATNGAWIWHEAQFEEVIITAEQTADGESNNYAIGGDYNGGTSESDNKEASPQNWG